MENNIKDWNDIYELIAKINIRIEEIKSSLLAQKKSLEVDIEKCSFTQQEMIDIGLAHDKGEF